MLRPQIVQCHRFFQAPCSTPEDRTNDDVLFWSSAVGVVETKKWQASDNFFAPITGKGLPSVDLWFCITGAVAAICLFPVAAMSRCTNGIFRYLPGPGYLLSPAGSPLHALAVMSHHWWGFHRVRRRKIPPTCTFFVRRWKIPQTCTFFGGPVVTLSL
jgi:hypothetical protein